MLKNRKGFLLAEDDMCGRFTLAMSPEDIAALLRLNQELDDELGLSPQHNIAPSQNILAAVQNPDHGTPEPTLLQWGLVPSWADDPSVGNRMINARSETAAEKPSFRDAFHSRRCLIPANGFYEWQQRGKSKQPWMFRAKDAPGFCFAGLWETWLPRDGSRTLNTCTILTTKANELMAPVHHRMPVIVPTGQHDVWWRAEAGDPLLQELFSPFPAEQMAAHPVSTLVNNPSNNSPECLVPVKLRTETNKDEDTQGQLF